MTNIVNFPKKDTTEPESTELVLNDQQMDEFERNLEQRPPETNLSLQRLLRRPTRWKE
ncbi:hypothetical protein Pori4_00028 [Pseudomonas phage vB_PpuM-Pori-4]